MTVEIDTPLLIVGGGPAALIAGTVASGYSMGSLIVGHEPVCPEEPVRLEAEVLEILKPHGVINVLLPYADSTEPVVIKASVFEQVLKHHCVVNMNITLYDVMLVSDLCCGKKRANATISDGLTQWSVKADRLLNTAHLPIELNGAIREGARLAKSLIAAAMAQ